MPDDVTDEKYAELDAREAAKAVREADGNQRRHLLALERDREDGGRKTVFEAAQVADESEAVEGPPPGRPAAVNVAQDALEAERVEEIPTLKE